MANISQQELDQMISVGSQSGINKDQIIQGLQQRGHTVPQSAMPTPMPSAPQASEQPAPEQPKNWFDGLAGIAKNALTGALNTPSMPGSAMPFSPRDILQAGQTGLEQLGSSFQDIGTAAKNAYDGFVTGNGQDNVRSPFLSGLNKISGAPLSAAMRLAPDSIEPAMNVTASLPGKIIGAGYDMLANNSGVQQLNTNTPQGAQLKSDLGNMAGFASNVLPLAASPKVIKKSTEILDQGINKAAAVGEGAANFSKELGSNAGREALTRTTGIGSELRKNIKTLTEVSPGEQRGAILEDAMNGKLSYDTAIPKITTRIENLVKNGERLQSALIPKLKSQEGLKVNIDPVSINKTLGKFGLEYGKEGLAAKGGDTANTALTPSQIGEFNNIAKEMTAGGVKTPLQFWNTRKKLGNVLAKLETRGEADANAHALSTALYDGWNKLGRHQIDGLEAYDKAAGSNIQLIDPIKRKLMNSDSTLQEKAQYVLEQLNNKSQANMRAAIEKIVPGITKEMLAIKTANMLKGIENNPTGSGNIRNTLGGAAGLGLITGNIPAALGAGTAFALTNPALVTKGFIKAIRAKEKLSTKLKKK